MCIRDRINYQRGEDLRAPAEFKALHPLATAPMLEVDGKFFPESGAIANFLVKQFGSGGLSPDEDSLEYLEYEYWMHYGVASGMQPIMYKVRAPGHKLTGSSYDKAADIDLVRSMDYLDSVLETRTYLVGEKFSVADIQASFVPELANALGKLNDKKNIMDWLSRLYERTAFQRSLELGSSYRYKIVNQ